MQDQQVHKRNFRLMVLAFVMLSNPSAGQMQGDHMQMQTDTMNMHGAEMPVSRDGSGTSWQPDQSPVMMYMIMHKNTTLMFHGAIFIRYTTQDFTNEGDRGGQQFDVPDWVMFMLRQRLGEKDLISFTSMLSFDRLTMGGSGYPLLFQTGEEYQGVPLVDRQHPHDLFSELAISYTHSFTKDIGLSGYFGYPGEPALGPNVFMHRPSAMNDPDAPLGHHWQDATHITFGVATLGLRYKIVKAEGSIFTGREPDENRYNFDKPLFDSYSYRVSVNPSGSFSVQFSQGFIKSPEAVEPAVNLIRTTASVSYTLQFNDQEFIASSLIWGMNHLSDGAKLNSLLLEANLKIKPITPYFRYEFVQKNASELQILKYPDNPVFNINAITLGLNRNLFTVLKTDLSVGIQGTLSFPGKDLATVYGNYPLAAEIYIKIAPAIRFSH
jgi:hypothetical protein